jgi:RNA polymerase sigma-70 factor, ECF subfamily
MSAAAVKADAGTSRLDSADFERLTGPFREELLAYCYRMLGSVQDAEDQVQETLLRAWRGYGGFEGRSSMRTWLYRIATNACLRALETRGRRPLPSGLGGPAEDPDAPLAAARPEVPWLQPIPDAWFGTAPADPAAVVVSRTSMRLALIAALQYLPPRQRAVLILRDVLGWRAAEVAGLLGTSTPAVNSALQRARDHLELARPAEDDIGEPASAADRELVGRYAAAFENADMAALVALLREDAVLEMPPLPGWFRGRDAVARFLGTRVMRVPCPGSGGPPRGPGEFKMVPAAANGQPALAAYLRDLDGVYHAHAIQVLTPSRSGLARIVSFNDPELFEMFGLPGTTLRSAKI